MSSIDPTVVRGFLDGIESARSSGSNALAALLNVDAAAPATAETLARVDASATDLATFSAKLDAATHLAAPRAAAEAAIDMSMLGVGEAQHHVAQLRSLLAAGPTDPAAAVAHASAARGALDRLLDDEYERLAALATTPGDGEAAALGVAGDDGAWRSFDDLAGEELAQAAARVGDPEADARALMGELEDTLRTANDHIHDGASGTSAFDADIAAYDLASELDRPDAVARIGHAETNPILRGTATLDELSRSAAPEVHDGTVPARIVPRETGRTARVTGEASLIDHLPRRGEVLATAQVARFQGGRVHELEAPLVSTGRSFTMPTRAVAIEGAKTSGTASRWLVLPNHDAGWTLAEVQFRGDHVNEIGDALHYGGGSLSGIRQQGAHVDTIVDKGSTVHVVPPTRDIEAEVLRRPVPDDLSGMAQIQRREPGTLGLPEAGSPVLRLEDPAAKGVVGTVANEFGVLVDGPRSDAMAELRSIVAKRHLAGVHALIQLAPGRYAVVNLAGVSGSAARNLARGITPDAINPNFTHDVEAVMAGSRHRAAGIDLRSGESL